jgi:hypothetical protein
MTTYGIISPDGGAELFVGTPSVARRRRIAPPAMRARDARKSGSRSTVSQVGCEKRCLASFRKTPG